MNEKQFEIFLNAVLDLKDFNRCSCYCHAEADTQMCRSGRVEVTAGRGGTKPLSYCCRLHDMPFSKLPRLSGDIELRLREALLSVSE